MPCVPCETAIDHARQDLQTNGIGVRDVRPRDGRENTTTFFLEHRTETPPRRTYRRKPTDLADWRPNTNIPAFLVQHLDRAHPDKSPIHTQRPESDFLSNHRNTQVSVRCFYRFFWNYLSRSMALLNQKLLSRSFSIYTANPVTPNQPF
jgi:hypothetical protein